MPPQQSHGLLDLLDQRFGFRAHDSISFYKSKARRSARLDRAAKIGAHSAPVKELVEAARACPHATISIGNLAPLFAGRSGEIFRRRGARLEGFEDGALPA